jgi:hypothetical protein
MSITNSTLTRGAAVATAVAGAIFILIQPLHPADDELASVTTSLWVVVHLLSMAMAVLGLAGITGVYLRQVTRSGVLGLVAYAMFALYFLLQGMVNFGEAFLAPLTAAGSPEFTLDFVGLFAGHQAVTDLGPLAVLSPIGSGLYLLGGILFGVTVIRAGVLARWAGILVVIGAVASLAAAVLPHEVGRYAAIPMGLALIGLGYSLWSEQRRSTATAETRSAELASASAA